MRTALVVLLVALGWASCLADQPLSPKARYRLAIEKMRSLTPPPYLMYRFVVPKGEASMTVSQLPDGHAKPYIQYGSSPYARASWVVAYRDVDGTAAVAVASGGYAPSTLALFDPTWHGAYLWLRHGLLATTQPAARSTAPNVTPSPPAAIPDTIAVVTAFDAGPYRIEDGGADRCVRRPAHRLNLIPLFDPDGHPLRRVVVDDASGRICTLRFALQGTDGRGSYRGYVDLHYADVGSYYLMTNGYIDVRIDVAGAFAGYAHIPFLFSQISFPGKLPGDLFAVATPTPNRRR